MAPSVFVQDLSHIHFVGTDTQARPALQAARGRLERSAALPEEMAAGCGDDVARDGAAWWGHRALPGEKADPFVQWVLELAGLNPAGYRGAALQRRVPACLRALEVPNAAEGRKLLAARPALVSKAIDALLIGVSEFFRDEAVFAAIEQVVLPNLLEQKSGLRILSLGCADGQELYSIAMLLDEVGALEGSTLMGIDCREAALEKARAGTYTELKGLLPGRVQRYFEVDGTEARISRRLRNAVYWTLADVANWIPRAPVWDLVLFRNVAIYFEAAEVSQTWERLGAALSEQGVLVTGKAERAPRHLPFRRLAQCVYQKQT